jgi:hypothetical protein
MANNPQSNSSGIIDRVTSGISGAVSETGLGKLFRSRSIPPGAEPATQAYIPASFKERIDWRVKLGLPSGGAFKTPEQEQDTGSDTAEGTVVRDPLAPLYATGGMVFPYTPNIYITYSANYDNLAPTHSNYPFPVYQNSAVDQFVITGEFTVENADEALYWIAANHYLRSVTKMDYGVNGTGAPPPVVKLDGYGDFVFKEVPVVVQQFNIELSDGVDYIKAPLGDNGSWAPTRSTIAVTLQPAYSRNTVSQFSLNDFVNGEYIRGDGRFI